jgi:diacylglycerol kinase family enzyme
MLRAHLIYNPNAQDTDGRNAHHILKRLLEAGYDPIYRPTVTEEDLDRVLEEVEGLVVIAGGDGSVHAVVERLVGREITFTVLPLGTANNIARTLGIEGEVDELLTGLAKPRKRPFDVARVTFRDRDICFLEGAGCGLLANAFAAFHEQAEGHGDEKGAKSMASSIDAAIAALETDEAFRASIKVDGNEWEGEFLSLEVLNTPFIGPNLRLAEEADPGDGRLEVVRIGPDARQEVGEYLRSLLKREVDELPSVERKRGETIEATWRGLPLHVDGDVQGVDEGEEVTARFDIYPGTLEVWLPQPSEDG